MTSQQAGSLRHRQQAGSLLHREACATGYFGSRVIEAELMQ
jgi:hypothetical protein